MFIVHCSHGATLIFDDLFLHLSNADRLKGLKIIIIIIE